MAIYDRTHGGYRIFIGDIGSRVGKYELEREMEYYGSLVDVWVARNPPGFAFVVYKYSEDAEKVVRDLDGRTLCGRRVRVEHARPYETRRRQPPPPAPPRSRYSRSSYRSRSRSRSPHHRRSSRRSRSHSGRYSDRSRSPSRERSRERKKSYKRSSSSRSHSRSRSASPSKQNHKPSGNGTSSPVSGAVKENGAKPPASTEGLTPPLPPMPPSTAAPKPPTPPAAPPTPPPVTQ